MVGEVAGGDGVVGAALIKGSRVEGAIRCGGAFYVGARAFLRTSYPAPRPPPSAFCAFGALGGGEAQRGSGEGRPTPHLLDYI